MKMTFEDIPKDARDWTVGMVNGTTSVRIGHMMGSSNENVQNLIPEYSLFLIRAAHISPLGKWVEEAPKGDERTERMNLARDFTANAMRDMVIRKFETARYPGD